MDPFPAFNRQRACRYGMMIYNPGDEYVGRALDLYGEFSEGEVELFRQFVEPGQAVVEVGANIGAHTVFLAQHVGPRGRVLAFEPQRILFQTLCANLALNSITNVMCLAQALGAERGVAKVPAIDYSKAGNFGSLELGQYQHGEPVAVGPLDAFGVAEVHLLKVDVEGMEEAVLRGAAETIAKYKPILYVENDRDDKSSSLVRYIDSLGYKLYWHITPYYNPDNFLQNHNDVFPLIASFNMLCLHKDSDREVTGFEPVQMPSPG